MIYKVVPAAMVISGTSYNVSQYFEEIISKHAAEGWQFYSMEKAIAEEAPGCELLSMAPKRTEMNLLVFCKPSPGENEPGAAPTAAPAKPAAQPMVQPAASPAVKPAAKPAAKPVAPEIPNWTCPKCGTSNKAAYGMCKKCGAYRSGN